MRLVLVCLPGCDVRLKVVTLLSIDVLLATSHELELINAQKDSRQVPCSVKHTLGQLLSSLQSLPSQIKFY